jgi:hypothetical protein
MKVAVVQSAMPTSPTANQDFTHATFSSDLKAAILFATRGVAAGTIAEEGAISIGLLDDEANQASMAFHDDDGIGTATDVRTEVSTSAVLRFADAPSSGSLGSAVGSILSNGARAAWSGHSGLANQLVSAFLLGGSDVEAEVVTATLNGTTDVTVAHGLSAAPHAIICLSPGNAANSNGTACRSVGFYDVAGATYRCMTHRQGSANTTTLITQSWYTDAIAVEHDNVSAVWKATINDVGATTFDVVASAATTDVLMFLCIRVTGGSIKVGDFTTRTSTGTQADISGMSLAPKAVLYATSFLSSGAGTIVGSSTCESFGFGAMVDNGGTTQRAGVAMYSSDGVDLSLNLTDTKSLTLGTRVGAFNGSGALGYAFDVSSWDSGGVTHDYSTFDGTGRRVIYLAIAPASGGGGGTPAFDSAPVVSSQTTSAYTVSYDANADATNIYGGAWLRGSAAPSASAIKAGTGAVATATENTTGSADTITVTIGGGDPFPVYDLYFVLEGGAGFSSVISLPGEMLDAPAGRQYVTKSGSPDAGEVGVLDGASPAAADGDVMDCATHADSHANGAAVNAIALSSDTTAVIDSNGDPSRQKFTIRFYDVSAGAWSDSPAPLQYWNNSPPQPIGLGNPDDGSGINPYLFEKGKSFSHSVDDLFGNVEGDAMTLAAQNMPAGGSIVGTDWTGAFTTYGVYPGVVLEATDVAGDKGTLTVEIIVGRVVPDIVNLPEAIAESLVESEASMTLSVVSSENNLSVPAGAVISQVPAAGTLSPPGQIVEVVMSLGNGEIPEPGFEGWLPVEPATGIWTPV